MSFDQAKSTLAWIKLFQSEADQLWKPPDEAPARGREAVLLRSITSNTRIYIEQLVNQINITYDVACFDASAVMIRRLVETLIIEVFEHHGRAADIKDGDGNFVGLAKLVDSILNDPSWNLSRNCKSGLKKIKKYGDRSAHSRYYLAHRGDIDAISDDVRVVVQELVHLARLK